MNLSFLLTAGMLQLLVVAPVLAQKSKAPAKKAFEYTLEREIKLPGNGSYDELYVDQDDRRLYITHGSNVQVVSLDSLKLVATLGPLKEAQSISIVREAHRGFISDSKANSIFCFDTRTLEKLQDISITGRKPHCITYDANSNVLFVFNWLGKTATVVDPTSLKEFGTVDLGGNPERAFTNDNGLLYTTLEDRNQLISIDTKRKTVFVRFPLTPCEVPTAISYDALNERIFVGCRGSKSISVVNAASGKTVATLPVGDKVGSMAYDPEGKLLFAACEDGSLSVFKQKSPDQYTASQTITTPLHTSSMALENRTGRIFLSTSATNESGEVLADSFKLLIYGRTQPVKIASRHAY